MYYITISHQQLGKQKVVTGRDPDITKRKAAALMAEWNAQYEKVLEKESRAAKVRAAQNLLSGKSQAALVRTDEATKAVESLRSLLSTSLKVNYRLDFEGSKEKPEFDQEPPVAATIRVFPSEPKADDPLYVPKLKFLDKVFKSRAIAKRAACAAMFDRVHRAWVAKIAELTILNEHAKSHYAKSMAEYLVLKDNHATKVAEHNAAIDDLANRYRDGDPTAIKDYCDSLVSNIMLPEKFPRECVLEYNHETKTLIVDFKLPDVGQLPNLKEVKYVKARDEFKETFFKADETNALYDDTIYQVCLLTLHALFAGDQVNALEAAVFNGIVTSVDRGTGQTVTACIMSVRAAKADFTKINLAQVDPRTCFRSLKGIGSSLLHNITPVAPILKINREDKRFVQAYGVADSLDDSVNLAAMDWEDFEHLIREIFEAEFKANGGEVKVTQASRDGGVDAVAFDPDPIRGGKIVIQAKRYTNTVGVSAVRDLYGTVMNEGATKGILVTTSDYGNDAFEFVKGKPLTLMNGANLLYLLQKHGRKAKIDLTDAKKQLWEEEASKRSHNSNGRF
jgi:restriction system protein